MQRLLASTYGYMAYGDFKDLKNSFDKVFYPKIKNMMDISVNFL